MERIKVLIYDSENEVKNLIEEILIKVEFIEIAGIAENKNKIQEILDHTTIDVLLINSGLDSNGYDLSETISINNPDLAIIILEDELEEESVHRAFFTGARDVIIKPITPPILIDSIYKVNQLTKKKANIHKEASIRSRKNSRTGRVFTIFSAKGGTGKTFVAVNLAVLLAQRSKEKRVVLVDLDFNYGNAALALNVFSGYTVSDIVDDISNINVEDIESYLSPHETGIWILPANTNPLTNEFINAEHVNIILRTLQNAFDYIIVDLPIGFNEINNPAITAAENLFLITTMDLAAIRNNKAALINLSQLNYPKSKMKIVLNQAENFDIKQKNIEAVLNYNIFASLSADKKNATSSLNLGIPYVLKHPYSKLTRDFNQMIQKLLETS